MVRYLSKRPPRLRSMKILHILIVEDEPWVAMDLEMIIIKIVTATVVIAGSTITKAYPDWETIQRILSRYAVWLVTKVTRPAKLKHTVCKNFATGRDLSYWAPIFDVSTTYRIHSLKVSAVCFDYFIQKTSRVFVFSRRSLTANTACRRAAGRILDEATIWLEARDAAKSRG